MMSRGTLGLVIGILTVVLVTSCFMLILENSKTMENLPALEQILEMDAGKADSRVSGYMEHQLMEAWGKPTRSDTENLMWRLPEGVVLVKADSKGMIVSCSRKRMADLPGLRDLAAMNEQEMNSWVMGQFADHLASVWRRPDRVKDQLFTWRLPANSAHREVTVEVNPWGMVESAEFGD